MRAYKVSTEFWNAKDESKQFKSYIFVKKQKSTAEASFFYILRDDNSIFTNPTTKYITTTESDIKKVIYDYIMSEYEVLFSKEVNPKNRHQLMIEPIILQ